MGEDVNETCRGVNAMSREAEAESARAVEAGPLCRCCCGCDYCSHRVAPTLMPVCVQIHTPLKITCIPPLVLPLCGMLERVENRSQGLEGGVRLGEVADTVFTSGMLPSHLK